MHDIAASVAYYRDVLGFHVNFVEGSPPSHGSVTRCRVGIQFTPAPAGYIPARHPGWIYIFVTDVDELYREYEGKGVTVTRPLASPDHGMREFEIRDGDGHRLRFGQYLSDRD